MTDIRQHLPAIIACIRQHLAGPDALEAIRAKLRELLPVSYGLGMGTLVSTNGERSQPFEIVIYDTTLKLPDQLTGQETYDLRQALAVIALAQELETPALQTLLHLIASAKSLRPRVPEQQGNKEQASPAQKGNRKPGQSLKKLLPLGIIAIQRLAGPRIEDAEAGALTLDTLLKEQATHLRPDYLLALAHGLFYRHPALAGGSFAPSTISIMREPPLKKPHPCYVCKQPFTSAHFFYQYLCPVCGDLNYQKRAIPLDLAGRTALVTGARVKIGYATALRLLRSGVQVIATTRFPHDAAGRYSQEPDFADWQDRLHIYGLDFRYLPVLERFVEHLNVTYPALDIVVNNAAQTVRRSPDDYAPLLALEQTPLSALPLTQRPLVQRSHETLPPTPFAISGTSSSPLLPDFSSDQIPSATLLHDYGPQTALARTSTDDLSIDQRTQNSWTLPFNQIDLTEFLEVQVINVTAPFLLISRLHPLLCQSSFAQRFIVNVSAVEGQFANSKQGHHVHTNMAKAALNMLTHTVAAQLARDSIYMNSVDPGWISQQAPRADRQDWERIQQLLPLDLLDAAARICDPIFMSILNGEASAGHFYKDYRSVSW